MFLNSGVHKNKLCALFSNNETIYAYYHIHVLFCDLQVYLILMYIYTTLHGFKLKCPKILKIIKAFLTLKFITFNTFFHKHTIQCACNERFTNAFLFAFVKYNSMFLMF